MPYDTALTTSLIDAILDNPEYQRRPRSTEYECVLCLALVRNGHCEHGERCLVTKAKAVKATYRHDLTLTPEQQERRMRGVK